MAAYERLAAKRKKGEITHEEYTRRLDELDAVTDRVEFSMAIAEGSREQARSYGWMTGNINQTDRWFRV